MFVFSSGADPAPLAAGICAAGAGSRDTGSFLSHPPTAQTTAKTAGAHQQRDRRFKTPPPSQNSQSEKQPRMRSITSCCVCGSKLRKFFRNSSLASSTAFEYGISAKPIKSARTKARLFKLSMFCSSILSPYIVNFCSRPRGHPSLFLPLLFQAAETGKR